MIYSLTPYCGESDVLEIRLGMLDEVVDRHVICEGTTTQRGNPKPLYFSTQLKRFQRWAKQITYIVCDLERNGLQPNWDREHGQRDAMVQVLEELQDDDLVLISDVDEIPRPELLRYELAAEHPLKLEMTMHMYYLNWVWREKPVRNGTRATLISGRKLLGSPQYTLTEFCEAGWPVFPEVAGWHLAYQLEPQAMKDKVSNIADDWFRERADWPLDHFKFCRETGWDLFNRPERQCDWRPDDEVPPYALEHRERFSHMFLKEPTAVAA